MAMKQGKPTESHSSGVDDVSGKARDREMGREGELLAEEPQDDPEADDDDEFEDDDEGDDEDEEGDEPATDADDVKAEAPPSSDKGDTNDQKGGDRSNRAAVSGASGERSTSGGANKPQPKNQDEKGMGHPRNR